MTNMTREQVVHAAERSLEDETRQNPSHLQTLEQIDEAMRAVLGDLDPLWPRWIVETDPKLERFR
jgi:hypothetical protein